MSRVGSSVGTGFVSCLLLPFCTATIAWYKHTNGEGPHPSVLRVWLEWKSLENSNRKWEQPYNPKRKKKKLMQFPREAQSYRTGNSITPRGILSHFQSLADPVDWAQLFFPLCMGRINPTMFPYSILILQAAPLSPSRKRIPQLLLKTIDCDSGKSRAASVMTASPAVFPSCLSAHKITT